MKSADCHRRAATAEQSAWLYRVTIKEEPEWGACGVSEAAARAGLYVGHEVEDELVVGPVLLQPQDVVYSNQVPPLNQELLEDIKQEPRQAGAGLAPAPVGRPGARPGEHLRSGDARQRQPALTACSMQLQRMPDDNKQHSCKTCLQTFDLGSSILRHSCVPAESKTNPKTIMNKNKLQDDTQKNTFPYVTCGKQFVHNVLPMKDMKMHTVETYSCPICKKVFKSYHALRRHAVTHIHLDEIEFSCDICGKQFRNQSHCIKHKQLHTAENPHKCHICTKQFRCSLNLSEHIMRTHRVVKPCLYKICTLTKHKLITTGEKAQSCQICKRQFKRKSDFSRHMRIHAGEKPYSCDICSKQFRVNYALHQHTRRHHTEEKPHSCQTCKQQFTRKSVLDEHMLTHLDDKSDSRDTHNKFSFNKHKLRTGEKLHSSQVCKKSLEANLHNNVITHFRVYSR